MDITVKMKPNIQDQSNQQRWKCVIIGGSGFLTFFSFSPMKELYYITSISLISFTNEIKHKINTADNIPVYRKSYRYPYALQEKQTKKMLDSNIIRPSNSPDNSPIWVVSKKSDPSNTKKWRLVFDYRKLNEKSVDDKYPIPNINEILDKL